MLQASSRFADDFPIAAGRCSAHLLARQEELRSFLSECGLPASAYPGCPKAGAFVHHRPGSLLSCVLTDADADRLGGDLKGSDAKDNLGSLHFTVAGAQVDSSLPTRESARSLWEPCLQNLQAAASPAITEELASILAGSWTSFLQFRKCLSCTSRMLPSTTTTMPTALTHPLQEPFAEPGSAMTALRPFGSLLGGRHLALLSPAAKLLLPRRSPHLHPRKSLGWRRWPCLPLCLESRLTCRPCR